MDVDAVQLLQTRVHEKKGCTDLLKCEDYDLATSDGENKCLNTESSGWGAYDCKGTNGRVAFGPTYCTYYKLAGRICCPNECIAADEPTLDLTTQVGQTSCLARWASGYFGWDCDGAPGFSGAAKLPHYCSSTDKNRIVPQVCCRNQCDLLITGTTAPPATTTTKKLDVPTTMTTTIPGGDTNPGGPDCFGAIASWGPDFDCNEKTDMFCGNDSPDGLDVSLCCQQQCGTKQEKRSKKNEVEGVRKANEATRKSDRKESGDKRKEAEAARKKQKKEDEWLSKRGEQEKKNKNAEDERKSKRGFSEGQKKNERKWKNGRSAAKKAAARRETKRKNRRADAAKKVARAEKKKKNKNADVARKKKTEAKKKKRESKKKNN